MKIQGLAVVVPARNEGKSVAACLESIVASLPAGLPSLVVLVDDGSTDGTAPNARSVLGGVGGQICQTPGGNVGAARRAGMRRALDHFDHLPPDEVWLACTDADSLVPKTWLQRQLLHAEAGAEAVAGIVRPIGLNRCAEFAFDERYKGKIEGNRHGHVHGANLGVRGSAYLAVGGFPPVPCHEDRLLWERLVAHCSRVVADPELIVATSGRSRGRLRGGFASDMAIQFAEAV